MTVLYSKNAFDLNLNNLEEKLNLVKILNLEIAKREDLFVDVLRKLHIDTNKIKNIEFNFDLDTDKLSLDIKINIDDPDNKILYQFATIIYSAKYRKFYIDFFKDKANIDLEFSELIVGLKPILLTNVNYNSYDEFREILKKYEKY